MGGFCRSQNKGFCSVWPWASCLTCWFFLLVLVPWSLIIRVSRKWKMPSGQEAFGVMAGWIWGRGSPLSPMLPGDSCSHWSQTTQVWVTQQTGWVSGGLDGPGADPSPGLFQAPALTGQRKSSGMPSTLPLTGM